jgi:hypothetical protein
MMGGSQERANHPVGTTVRVNDLWKHHPVRHENALKAAAKSLVIINGTLQAYAFARPAVRFSLKVLKARNNKGDWVYAPKRDASMADAALKIVGKETAGQCSSQSYDWLKHPGSSTQDADQHVSPLMGAAAATGSSIRIDALLPNLDAGKWHLCRGLGACGFSPLLSQTFSRSAIKEASSQLILGRYLAPEAR